MQQTHDYETLFSYVMEKTNNRQMTEEEYRYVASFLGDKNFLVFGTGYDSDLWRRANKNGLTFFLENNKQWITNYKDTFVVNYNTKRTQAKKLLREYNKGNTEKLEIELPEQIKNISWDIIFVDSPEGHSKTTPGRMQSIYMARRLSQNHTEILIHDCNRFVEDIYSKAMFKEIKMFTKLRHCRL